MRDGMKPRREKRRWLGAARTVAGAAALVALALASFTTPGRAQGEEPPQPRMLDSFDGVAAWSAHPSDGVSLDIGSDTGRGGGVMRLDFDFHGGAGYAIARRKVDLELPDDYEFVFWVRGDTPPQNLEFKLLDSTGDNVWWHNAPDFEFTGRWMRVRYRARDISFAWGPAGGGKPRHIAGIEIVVTAGRGGRGTVWVDDLSLRLLPPPRPYDLVPALSASSAATGHGAALALDGDTATTWRSASGGEQWLAMDFQRRREYGGVTIDWESGAHATAYSVDTSSDGARWKTAYTVHGGDGGRDYIPLRDGESRWLRIAMHGGASPGGYALRDVRVEPVGWADSANALFRHIAADAPRGSFPRYFYEEQSYWTVVGVNGGYHNGLLNEDGLLESDRAGFSIEPFLYSGGRLTTWADAAPRQSLARGYLPIPSVEWSAGKLSLLTTAFAYGDSSASTLVARYRVRNTSKEELRATLFLAIRPFQVNPPWQFLNVPGGIAPIHGIARDGAAVVVNGDRRVIPITRGAGFGAASFDEGGIAPRLREGRLPSRSAVLDSAGWAEGALSFALTIPPGGARDVAIEIPFPRGAPNDYPGGKEAEAPAGQPHGSATRLRGTRAPLRDSAAVARQLAAVEARWAELLGRVSIVLPPAAMDIVRTLRSTMAYILINRDGPRIQPGSRAYSRSWIRDGSLESAALLRLGYPDAVRAFAEWYAPFQFPNGKVPCCVDARGADPVPENDSHGELIFLVMEYYRYTHDQRFLERMWPHISRAVAYIDTLRAQRMTPEYRAPAKRAYFGLLPQSISHEGYSAKPMHSYWDDFFALRGLKDAADAAAVLGREAEARRIASMRDDLRRDIMRSIELSMAEHHIDYIPGSVELGDFDATSTTIAVEPVGELANLPGPALRSTFERYWKSASHRPDSSTWDAYTPYELRTVGTFVRLGWRRRAHEMLAQFMSDRRPAAWNQWAEVVWREPRTPEFIGDMPHTWVGSDFVRSVVDMFAYDRESDSALVVGAGIPAAWVDQAPGVEVRSLRTPHGTLDLGMRGDGHTVTVHLGGKLTVPRGGIAVRSPYDRPIRSATIDGRPAVVTESGEVLVRELPATVVLRSATHRRGQVLHRASVQPASPAEPMHDARPDPVSRTAPSLRITSE